MERKFLMVVVVALATSFSASAIAEGAKKGDKGAKAAECRKIAQSSPPNQRGQSYRRCMGI
jgi:hypothetical protein